MTSEADFSADYPYPHHRDGVEDPMKECRNCDKGELTGTKENYLYTQLGLPNVVLVDVEVRRCSDCGTHEVVVPCIEELYRTIALAVVRKPSRLSGMEVRFLRNHLGLSGRSFADHMGVDPSTVSNWENGKTPIGTTSDRLLRLMSVHQASVQDYALTELTQIADTSASSPEPIRVRQEAKGWELASA